MSPAPILSSSRVRLYRILRTAHLERAHEFTPAAFVHVHRRHDFDESLAEGLELVRASTARTVLLLLRNRIEVLEINEPLMTTSLPSTAAAVLAVRLRGWVTRFRTDVVCYAIENRSPWPTGGTWRSRPRIRARRLLAAYLGRNVDRMCFGTAASEQTYARLLPHAGRERRLVPALPAAQARGVDKQDGLVLFLGEFVTRKGVDRVLEAWPQVRSQVPTARLRMLGHGRLQPMVLAAATADSGIEVVVDPPRRLIHLTLEEASVLVLPSQPTPNWREQVGLPIVEGLAAGCRVVTTGETGLAGWLEAHGHTVMPAGSSTEDLAAALVAQVRSGRTAEDVTADLPGTDGRLLADTWLFTGADERITADV